MLKSWSIKNFKPIVDSGELQLAPVTVLAGRNSSGKSSLLQSILMIAQTLGSRLLDRPLLPNERIVQLGTYENILSEITHSRTLELQFGLEMKEEELRVPSRLRTVNRLSIKSAQFSVEFGSATGNGTLSSAIEASKVVVEHARLEADTELLASASLTHSEARKISFELQNVSEIDIQRFLENVPPEQKSLFSSANQNNNYLGHFEQLHSNNLQEFVADQYLVALSHFLPFRFTRKYNIGERRKKVIESAIHHFFDSYGEISSMALNRIARSLDTEAPISENLRDGIDILCEFYSIDKRFSGNTLKELATWAGKLRNNTSKRKIFTEIQEEVLKDQLNNVSSEQNFEGLESPIHNIYLEALEQAIDQINTFFTSKIRYLGPLRADPQASQKFSQSGELDDVGTKGECAAAVYDANQIARIEWFNPQSNRIEKGELKEALDCWAQYIGVAQQIKTEMAGLSGISWKIIPKEGRQARSLPEVGVGISQVLPILVMGLLSPTNSLLIIEQPELHLHPYVQARLGDFFMGLAKCKKQCLIETHSENLVSQLRLHIVEAGGLEKSDCTVYFVDQDERGAAQFKQIEISPNGNIMNWPDGFFDETMLQEDRITAASLRKRAKKAQQA